ncbi:MAG: hypothetical protein IJC74_02345 [Clostridia bacterium]|nr:hypothetical protein [Clostridia bacterium]
MKGIVKRNDKVAFYGVENDGVLTYHRMTNFTELATSKNPKEYSRQYVDKEYEEADVVGYSPSVAYSFDQHTESAVHTDLVKIHDEELTGEDAIRSILIVDLTSEAENGFNAWVRDFAVIPDREGDSMEAYTYSGTFKVKGDKLAVVAVSADEWRTCELA